MRQARVRSLSAQALCGYVLKKDSPSCGMAQREGTKAPALGPDRESACLPRLSSRSLSSLPVEEEGRLSDPRLRENFIEHSPTAACRTCSSRGGPSAISCGFHAHKLVLMAHTSPRTGGSDASWRMQSHAADNAAGCVTAPEFMAALPSVRRRRSTPTSLQHMVVRPKRPARCRVAHGALDGDRRLSAGTRAAVAPLTLIRHHVRCARRPPLVGQI